MCGVWLRGAQLGVVWHASPSFHTIDRIEQEVGVAHQIKSGEQTYVRTYALCAHKMHMRMHVEDHTALAKQSTHGSELT